MTALPKSLLCSVTYVLKVHSLLSYSISQIKEYTLVAIWFSLLLLSKQHLRLYWLRMWTIYHYFLWVMFKLTLTGLSFYQSTWINRNAFNFWFTYVLKTIINAHVLLLEIWRFKVSFKIYFNKNLQSSVKLVIFTLEYCFTTFFLSWHCQSSNSFIKAKLSK